MSAIDQLLMDIGGDDHELVVLHKRPAAHAGEGDEPGDEVEEPPLKKRPASSLGKFAKACVNT